VDNGTVNITLEDESITIEDNGVGIPAEQLSYIFEPFYCVDKSRSKKLGGHGLGLAIAKNILDSHNIKIKITSDHEKGTTIILSK
jgi:signal transduction histidine kinase